MSKHDVEQARDTINWLKEYGIFHDDIDERYDFTDTGFVPSLNMVLLRLTKYIHLLEHQTERVMELEREREELHGKNVALQSQLDAWNKIEQGRMKDKSDDPDAWREKYKRMQAEGWCFEHRWASGDWYYGACTTIGGMSIPYKPLDFNVANPDVYRIAHGPIPDGWEYAGKVVPKRGEKGWCTGDWSDFPELLADYPYHCIRRKEKDKVAKVTITDPHIEDHEIESVSHNEGCVSPVSDNDPYAEAKATMPEGAEWCGFIDSMKRGYRYWWLQDKCCWVSAQEVYTTVPYCRIPLDVPPGPEDVGKPVMVQADCSQSWVRYDSFLCRANGLYWVLDRKIRTLALGFSNARKCREGE